MQARTGPRVAATERPLQEVGERWSTCSDGADGAQPFHRTGARLGADLDDCDREGAGDHVRAARPRRTGITSQRPNDRSWSAMQLTGATEQARLDWNGGPGGYRTRDHSIKSRMLYH